MNLIRKIANKDLVIGLPMIKFNEEISCDICYQEKQTRASFKSKNEMSTSKPLHLLHMDLFGPIQTRSIGEKFYTYVVIDDFSRFKSLMFLASKDEAFQNFVKLAKRVERERDDRIVVIKSDHGGEFENKHFMEFCEANGIL